MLIQRLSGFVCHCPFAFEPSLSLLGQHMTLYFQTGNLAFNKAKLMNIAFLYAMKEDSYDCVVFHDVDLLPEDDRLMYTCKDKPHHLSVSIDKYGYRYKMFFCRPKLAKKLTSCSTYSITLR